MDDIERIKEIKKWRTLLRTHQSSIITCQKKILELNGY